MARGEARGRGRGRRGGGRGTQGRGSGRDGETASNSEESIHNTAPVQGVDAAALRTVVMDSLREILGQGPLPNANAAPPPPPPPAYNPMQDLRQDYWRVLKLMRDLGTGTFSGGTNPIAADNWRKQLERNFASVRCPPEYQRELAASFLLDEAQVWWEKVERTFPPGYEISWNVFRDEFNRKYFPQEAMNQLQMEFLNLRQDNRTVREYEREFSRLLRFSTGAMDEQSQIQKFLLGLRLDIRKICQIRDYGSLIELVERASLTEQTNEAERKLARNYPQKPARAPEAPRQQQQVNRGAGQGGAQYPLCGTCGRYHDGPCRRNTGLCYNCGEPGHTKSTCTKFMGECHQYGRRGHRSRDCRVRPFGQMQGNKGQRQLPPPPKRQAVQPRVNVAGDHGGAEPIAGKSVTSFRESLYLCIVIACVVSSWNPVA